jgi:hypothetical protein
MNCKKLHLFILLFFIWLIIEHLFSAENELKNLFCRSFCRPLDSAARGGRTSRTPQAMPLHVGYGVGKSGVAIGFSPRNCDFACQYHSTTKLILHTYPCEKE